MGTLVKKKSKYDICTGPTRIMTSPGSGDLDPSDIAQREAKAKINVFYMVLDLKMHEKNKIGVTFYGSSGPPSRFLPCHVSRQFTPPPTGEVDEHMVEPGDMRAGSPSPLANFKSATIFHLLSI